MGSERVRKSGSDGEDEAGKLEEFRLHRALNFIIIVFWEMLKQYITAVNIIITYAASNLTNSPLPMSFLQRSSRQYGNGLEMLDT